MVGVRGPTFPSQADAGPRFILSDHLTECTHIIRFSCAADISKHACSTPSTAPQKRSRWSAAEAQDILRGDANAHIAIQKVIAVIAQVCYVNTMRVTRGLLRLWLVLSVFWVTGVALNVYNSSYTKYPWRSATEAVGVALGPPALALVLGAIARWVVRGFRP